MRNHLCGSDAFERKEANRQSATEYGRFDTLVSRWELDARPKRYKQESNFVAARHAMRGGMNESCTFAAGS